MKIMFKNIALLFLMAAFITSCTEPYALQTNTFEDALVVEATLTNEMKTQKIKLTRTFRFEDTEPEFESGASVFVFDESGTPYEFTADPESGYYLSVIPFQAIPGKTYRLNIETSDGNTYNSTPETLTAVNNMQDVTATVGVKNGQRGVLINAKSFDPTHASNYYRYEYEETYKIIAPAWNSQSLILIPPPVPGNFSTYQVQLVPNENLDTRICYTTKKSNTVIVTDTKTQNEDRVDYTIRFISDEDYIISHRYSILVHQYVQNLAAYTFYKTLKDISGSGEGILSQNQPGFFYGNLKSTNNPEKKVIGFFDVSSVSSKRIFFNYSDLFPGEDLPPYVVNCEGKSYMFCFGPSEFCNGNALVSGLLMNTLLYMDGINPSFVMVPSECGDCTRFSSNVIPPFWE